MNEIILRPNQVVPVQKGIEFFNEINPKPSLIVAPTAWGKSFAIAEIANRINDKVLILQPSKELLEQNYDKLLKTGGRASIYSASMGIKEIGDITYATIGSIKKIGQVFKDFGFKKMIIDEADRFPRSTESMLGGFLKDSEIKHVLGLTATPLKLQTNSVNMEAYSILKMLTSRSKHGNFFKEIIHICQVQEMVKLGYWSPLVYEIYDFDTGELVYNSTKADFTDVSLTKAYENQNIEYKILTKLEEISDRNSILVFVPSVHQAIELAKKIPNAAAVYGDMDKKERASIISRFRSLSLRVVVNVNVLSIGFDHPELDCIISGRPTASLAWWYQAIGRSTRIHPNKKDALIVDFAGNTPKFGKIDHLYFKKDKSLWKLYGEGGKLLTGIAMDQIGEITEQTEVKALIKKQLEKNKPEDSKIITFGKFQGKEIKDTPSWWRDWMLKNYEFNSKTEYIKTEILNLQNQ